MPICNYKDPFDYEHIDRANKNLKTAVERSSALLVGSIAEVAAYLDSMREENIYLKSEVRAAKNEVTRLKDKLSQLRAANLIPPQCD